eukprot:555649-Pelagomonas_calceolata.AAC.2
MQHSIGPMPNPYEQAITIIGRTLEAFDDDNLMPDSCSLLFNTVLRCRVRQSSNHAIPPY